MAQSLNSDVGGKKISRSSIRSQKSSHGYSTTLLVLFSSPTSSIFQSDLTSCFVQGAADDALAHANFVTQVASALNSPSLFTKKVILDILVFIVYSDNGRAHELIVEGLKCLSQDNHEPGGCYAYWFKSFEQALIGRGKMGTLVGASEEVKRHGGADSSLNEYTVSTITRKNRN